MYKDYLGGFIVKILLVDGTIIGTKTRVILNSIQKYIEEIDSNLELEMLNLVDYNHEFVDGRPSLDYNDDMKNLIKKFEEADGYIIATPIFQGSIPGVLKNTFDHLHPRAMRYKPVSIVANGGTHQHHLVVENQLKPILDYFRCLVTPNYVYTHASHFDRENNIIDEDVHDRLCELARVFVRYAEMSKNLSIESIDEHK